MGQGWPLVWRSFEKSLGLGKKVGWARVRLTVLTRLMESIDLMPTYAEPAG